MDLNVSGNYSAYDGYGSNNVGSGQNAAKTEGKKQSWLSRLFKGKKSAQQGKQLNNLHSKLDYLDEQLQTSSKGASGENSIEKMGKFDNDKEGGKYTNNQVYSDWEKMDDAAFNEKYAKEGVLTASETYTPDSIRELLGRMSKSEAGKILLKEDFGIDNPEKLSKMNDKKLVKKFYDSHKKAADEQAKEGGKGGGAAATAFDTAGLNAKPPYFRQLTIYQGKENHVMSADASQMTDDPNQARGMSPDMLY